MIQWLQLLSIAIMNDGSDYSCWALPWWLNDSVTSFWALPWMIQWQQLSTAIDDTVTVVEHCYNKWISDNGWALTPIIQWLQFEQYPSMIQWPLLTTAIMNDPVTSVQHWFSDHSWAVASTIQWLQSSSDYYSWALPSVIPWLQLSIAINDAATTAEHCHEWSSEL